MIWYGLFALLISICVWSFVLPYRRVSLGLATLFYVAAVVAAPVLYYDLLSKPKARTDEMFRTDKEVEVLTYHAIKDEGVFMLLELPGVPEPRYYSMPWNEQTMNLLREMQKLSKRKQPVVLQNPWERSLEKDQTTVKQVPPRKLPPKEQGYDDEALIYRNLPVPERNPND